MKYYCVANWKMNFNTLDAIKFIDDLIKNNLQNSKTKIILCPSFVSLKEVREKILDHMIELGAQNIHHSDKGAFTGEISANMLKEIECEWVILGHSERRQYFNEEDIILNDKLNIAIKSGLKPILCIGENRDQRNNNETFAILKRQLDMALNKINVLDKEILIAYEPVWAIGAGTPATVATIKETVDWVKEYLLQKLSINIPILYGGSVSKTNCAEIVQLDNVDGFLIGTSSLDVSEFYNIYSIMNER
tara:strand:- start:315 stop:1058 length:744 start_codon:yes stop_codon:yes gene_type:complete